MKDGLKTVGWLNFFMSIVGSAMLFLNSSVPYIERIGKLNFESTKTDPTRISMGLAILFFGLTINVICHGIAKVLDNQEKFTMVKESNN